MTERRDDKEVGRFASVLCIQLRTDGFVRDPQDQNAKGVYPSAESRSATYFGREHGALATGCRAIMPRLALGEQNGGRSPDARTTNDIDVAPRGQPYCLR